MAAFEVRRSMFDTATDRVPIYLVRPQPPSSPVASNRFGHLYVTSVNFSKL